MMNKKGFTLVELMVVIVIIGVLAAVAIPKFSAATNKAKASEFPTVLSTVVSAQKTNFAEVNTYANCDVLVGASSSATATTPSTIWSNLGVEVDASSYFEYTAPAADPANTFSAVATLRKAKLGSVPTSSTATVDQSGTKTASGSGATSLQSLAKSFFAS